MVNFFGTIQANMGVTQMKTSRIQTDIDVNFAKKVGHRIHNARLERLLSDEQKLIWAIGKLQRKLSVVNKAPEADFIKLLDVNLHLLFERPFY
jgi:hypothetical protein